MPAIEIADELTFVELESNPDLFPHTPTSEYVEWYWLPVIGPSTYVIYRRANEILDTYHPRRMTVDTDEFAGLFGLRRELFSRSLGRLAMFGLAHSTAFGTIEIRPRLPELPRRHVARFGPGLQARFLSEHGSCMST